MIKMPPVALPTENGPKSPQAPSAAEKKAASEFEAIFLRKMLSSMEKSTKVEGSSLSSSADAYSSMIVGALADAVAAAGGIGLAKSLLHSIEGSKGQAAPEAEKAPSLARGSPPLTHEHRISEAFAQGSDPRTVHGLRKGRE
jgi:Rod binding domain-containing protein